MKWLATATIVWQIYLTYQYNNNDSTESNCQCGTSNSKRVIGGKESVANGYPWVVGILDLEDLLPFCTGSIITEWHVLTTRSCLYEKKHSKILVCVGVHDITKCQSERNAKLHIVARIKRKMHYSYYNHEGDIAIVRTKTNIVFNQYVGPVCFPKKKLSYSRLRKYELKVIGWGNPTLRTLQELDLLETPLKTCLQWHSYMNPKKHICTQSPQGGHTKRDRGAPLVWLDKEAKRYVLIGIAIMGPDEKTIHIYPTLNTNVTAHRLWVFKKIAGRAKVCLAEGAKKPGIKTIFSNLYNYFT